MDFKIDDLIKFGEAQCRSGYEFGGFRNYYIIHFVLSGKGEYTVGNKTWRLNANDAFLIRPNEKHLYKADIKDPWKYTWVCFSGDIEGVLNKVKIDEYNLCAHIDNMNEVLSYLKNLKVRTIYQKPSQYLINIGSLSLILSKFIYEGSQRFEAEIKDDKMSNNHVMAMTCYIEQNYMNPITVSDVIHYIQLDRSYASNLYKKVKNISIYDDIQARRILKAVNLFNTNCSIKEITYICGFKNYQNFLSVFKSHFNMTPGEYRLSRQSK